MSTFKPAPDSTVQFQTADGVKIWGDLYLAAVPRAAPEGHEIKPRLPWVTVTSLRPRYSSLRALQFAHEALGIPINRTAH